MSIGRKRNLPVGFISLLHIIMVFGACGVVFSAQQKSRWISVTQAKVMHDCLSVLQFDKVPGHMTMSIPDPVLYAIFLIMLLLVALMVYQGFKVTIFRTHECVEGLSIVFCMRVLNWPHCFPRKLSVVCPMRVLKLPRCFSRKLSVVCQMCLKYR